MTKTTESFAQRHKYANRQIHRPQTHRQIHRQTDRQTDTPYRQTDRQADTQTDEERKGQKLTLMVLNNNLHE